jgi:hypothetical protein
MVAVDVGQVGQVRSGLRSVPGIAVDTRNLHFFEPDGGLAIVGRK